jgi:hypothetical protein
VASEAGHKQRADPVCACRLEIASMYPDILQAGHRSARYTCPPSAGLWRGAGNSLDSMRPMPKALDRA